MTRVLKRSRNSVNRKFFQPELRDSRLEILKYIGKLRQANLKLLIWKLNS